MKAIEFETVSRQHSVRLPDCIPDGTRMRVLLLLEDHAPAGPPEDGDLKDLLAGLTEGLTEEDLLRPLDPNALPADGS
jgi:hypothetical protein